MANLTIDVVDPDGSSAGTALLPEELFGVQTNIPADPPGRGGAALRPPGRARTRPRAAAR